MKNNALHVFIILATTIILSISQCNAAASTLANEMSSVAATVTDGSAHESTIGGNSNKKASSIEEILVQAYNANSDYERKSLFKKAAAHLLTFALDIPYDRSENSDWVDPNSGKPGSERLYLVKLFVITFLKKLSKGYRESLENKRGEIEYELVNSNDDSSSIKELFEKVPKKPKMNARTHKEIEKKILRIIVKFLRLWRASGFEWEKGDVNVQDFLGSFGKVYEDMKTNGRSALVTDNTDLSSPNEKSKSNSGTTKEVFKSFLRGEIKINALLGFLIIACVLWLCGPASNTDQPTS